MKYNVAESFKVSYQDWIAVGLQLARAANVRIMEPSVAEALWWEHSKSTGWYDEAEQQKVWKSLVQRAGVPVGKMGECLHAFITNASDTYRCGDRIVQVRNNIAREITQYMFSYIASSNGVDYSTSVAQAAFGGLHDMALPTLNVLCDVPLINPVTGEYTDVGIDLNSGVLYRNDLQITAPTHVSKKEGDEALRYIREVLLEGFTFATPEDRTIAISMILTPFLRVGLKSSPMFCITAPITGTGKTALAHIITHVRSGTSASILTADIRGDELRKYANALTLLGITSPVITIDNMSRPLRGDMLCSLTSESDMIVRPLGKTDIIRVRNNAVWLCTGNNIRVEGDMCSRIVLCSLIPPVEKPLNLLRKRRNLFEWLHEHRAEAVSAVLQCIKAWYCAGKPVKNEDNIHLHFADWCNTVVRVLSWYGFNVPLKTEGIMGFGQLSPMIQSSTMIRLFNAILLAFKTERFRQKDLLTVAHVHGLEVTSIQTAGQLLSRFRGVVASIDGVRFRLGQDGSGAWRLTYLGEEKHSDNEVIQ